MNIQQLKSLVAILENNSFSAAADKVSLSHSAISLQIRTLEEEFGQPHGEAAMLLASLYMVGRHGEFDPSATKTQKLEGPRYPFPSAWTLRKHGVTLPYYFVKPNNHVGRYPGLTLDDAPRLAEIYRDVILETARGLPEHYDRYQKDMWKAMEEAPWDRGD